MENTNKLRSPYRLLFLTAFLLPGVNNLIFGGGMLVCRYFGMNSDFLLFLSEVLGIFFNALRCALLTATVMTLGFLSGKEGFKRSLAPTGAAVLFSLLAGFLSVGVESLMIVLGWIDQTASDGFFRAILPFLAQFAVDLSILAAILLVACAAFAIVGAKFGRRNMLSGMSPYFVTVLMFIAAYTLALMLGQIKVVISGEASEGFIVRYILPFVYQLIYGAAMVVTAYSFTSVLSRYFYHKKNG